MAMPSSSREFHRSMSTKELMEWLRIKGLSQRDCQRLEDEEFTAKSFILLDKASCKDLGLGLGGQLLVVKLVEELKDNLAKGEIPLALDLAEINYKVDELRVSESEEVCDYDFQHIEIPFKLLPLCTGPPYDLTDSDDQQEKDSLCSVAAAAAFVIKEKVWKGRQVLKVFFMNPKVLEGWLCDGKRMSVEMIMEWVRVWEQAPSSPRFICEERRDKADIRVQFSDKGGCWSLVGMQADSCSKLTEPTMMLNLSNKALPETFKRHLVVHEFGHALGLEHEHQRSDFWECVKDFIDMKRMKDDDRFVHYKSQKGAAAFGRDYLATKEVGDDCCSSKYDSKSIMHYWFDVLWLKNKAYHKRKGITSDPNLTAVQKKCLMGIHDRNNSCAPKPSPTDIETLERAYDVTERG